VIEYQKIPGPFKRYTEGPKRNQLIEGDWSEPELGALADAMWIWTEKVDGTNIRVHWDGHKVTYGGRTDNAQIPAKLLPALDALLTEELFEQQFGATPATLFGEGYGAGIQKGGVYRADMSFVLFDVRVEPWWLLRENVEQVATGIGLEIVPVRHCGPIWEAIKLVQSGELRSQWNPDALAEGLVGVTTLGLLNRAGHRIAVKVKAKDFPGGVS
jgi:hypothetical protein